MSNLTPAIQTLSQSLRENEQGLQRELKQEDEIAAQLSKIIDRKQYHETQIASTREALERLTVRTETE